MPDESFARTFAPAFTGGVEFGRNVARLEIRAAQRAALRLLKRHVDLQAAFADDPTNVALYAAIRALDKATRAPRKGRGKSLNAFINEAAAEVEAWPKWMVGKPDPSAHPKPRKR